MITELRAFKSNLLEFFKRKMYIISMLIIMLMAYGFEITNFTLSNDEEQYINGVKDVLFWLQDARFGFTILNSIFLKFGMFGPFLSTLVAVILLFLSATIFCVIFERLNTKRKISTSLYIIFSGLYCTVPFVIAEYMCFSTVNIQFSLGLCFVAYSIYCLILWRESHSKSLYILSILSAYLSFSFYQGLFSFYITVACIFIMFELFQEELITFKIYFNIVIKYILIFLVGTILYFTTCKLISLFVMQRNYLNTMISSESYIETIINIFKRFYVYNNDYGMNIMKYVTLAMIAFLLIYLVKKPKKFIAMLFTSVVSIISPWITFILLHTSNVQFRSLFGIQIFVGGSVFIILYGIWYTLFEETKNKILNTLKVITYLISITTCLYQVQIINDLFYSDNIRYKSDLRITEHILDNISEDFPDYLNKQIIFVGGMTNPRSNAIHRLQVLGMSIFEWEGGNNARIIPFINSMGYQFSLPTAEEKSFAEQAVTGLPIYPETGYIVNVDDIIIVHIGEIQ